MAAPSIEDLLILLVDDAPTTIKIARLFLNELGYKNIISAENGKTAWDAIKENFTKNTPVQLIISDWNMPIMNGFELLKLVREDKDVSKTPFLLLTAETEQKNIISAIRIGVSGYIIKPVDKATLQEKLSKLFGK